MVEDADLESTADDDASAEPSEDRPPPSAAKRRSLSEVGVALVFSATAVLASAALVGWHGYRAIQSHHTEEHRDVFLQVARQGALNLSTISYTEVDADVHRILDSSTGTYHDDFEKNSQPFVDLVKHDQSKTEGTITEAGLQSWTDDSARVLVSLAMKTTTAAAPDPQVRHYRLRVDVQRVHDGVKVSNVEFIPQ